MADSAVETVLRRDRHVTIAALGLLCLMSWFYVIAGAGTGMSALGMTTWQFPPKAMAGSMQAVDRWTPFYWLTVISMWWVMMIAMMIPSAAPMVLLYARVYRHGQKKGQLTPGIVPLVPFVGGYLAAWLGFSTLAAVAQHLLERAGLMHAMMMWVTSTTVTGVLLLLAGLYQFTPIKQVCLKHCRSPAEYLSRHWRGGSAGAWRIGLAHGSYCLGCCWLLMALLFAGGVMNLVWIVGLAVLVVGEKLAPGGEWIARISGLALLAAGMILLVG